jgi:hypothetical protein
MTTITKKQVCSAAMNLSENHEDIFHWDWGSVFAHRKHIPVNHPILILIEARIRQLLKKKSVPYISLYTIFQNEYRQQCQDAGIPSAFALYACLKAKGVKGITFMRSPYVSTSNQKQARTNIEILNNWAKQRQDIFTRDALKNYANKIGIDSYRFQITYAYLSSVVRYDEENLIHLDLLDWNARKNHRLTEIAFDYWKECRAQKKQFAYIDDLLTKRKKRLPKLANEISWTAELLFSLLSRNKNVLMFGNTHLAYGFPHGKTAPGSLGDIVFKALRDKFDGKTNLKEISIYLRNELRLIKNILTSGMVQNHPSIVIKEHKIYIPKKYRN